MAYLSAQQKQFNYRLSKARVIIEHTYGQLKGRWRCLLKRLDIDLEFVPELVPACCVLHNICEVNGDPCNSDWLEDPDVEMETDSHIAEPSSGNAVETRKALMAYFQTD